MRRICVLALGVLLGVLVETGQTKAQATAAGR
jgi:hypothetical protein